MRVQSLALLSGFRVRHLCGCGLQLWLKKKKDEVFLYSPHPTGIGEGRAIIDE